jgi:hypothetical protein
MPPKIVTASELSDELRVPYQDVLKLAREGTIPVIRSGRALFFNLGAVVKALRGLPRPTEETAELAESSA